MDPNEAADLVNSFVDAGSGDGTTVTFTRIVDTTTVPPGVVSASCSASVRNYTPRELVGGLMQGDTNLRIGGDSLSALVQLLGTPPTFGDRVKYAGFDRNVQSSSPIIMGDKVVVIDVLVRG
jgi:hypothetical protein